MTALRPWYTPETCPYAVEPIRDLPGQLTIPGFEPPGWHPPTYELTRRGYVSPQRSLFDAEPET